MARLVKGHYVTPKTTPEWWRSGAYGTPRPRWEKPHYVDARGRWVPKPGTTKKTTIKKTTTGLTAPPFPNFGTYSGGLSDEELARRAAALADSQIAARQAAIERQRAAAYAQAQRDAATYQALGSAQMGMIGQIPANIQAIRNTAGQAIAQYGNQVSAAQAQALGGEQAQNAAFAAAQTGGTPAVAPAPTDGGAPAPTGPGPAGPIGVNAQAAMAASAQMGGVLPAREQAEIGAASAAAATGMPAVVARATQDTVAMRMAQAATEDADFRQQLLDASYERGGIYQDALNNMYELEDRKLGRFEAEQKRKQDIWELQYKTYQDQLEAARWEREFRLKLRGQKAAETISGLDRAKKLADLNRTKALTAQGQAGFYKDGKWGLTPKGYKHNAQGQLVKIPGAKTPKGAGPDYYTDQQGRRVPKGYRYNANGELVSIGTPSKGPTKKPQPQVVTWAHNRADAIATQNAQAIKSGEPRVRQLATVQQIIDEIGPQLMTYGFTAAQIRQIALKAASRHYRPYAGGKKQPSGGSSNLNPNQ
jgi:hypothetical protein